MSLHLIPGDNALNTDYASFLLAGLKKFNIETDCMDEALHNTVYCDIET
jgi:hypothetical protein